MTLSLTHQIRPVRVPEDLPALANLFNQTRPEPTSAEEIQENWRKVGPESSRHRLVAFDDAGAILGYGGVAWDPWDLPGRWFTGVNVDKAARGRGVGSALLNEAEARARSQGATAFEAEVRDHDPNLLAWAERRGYRSFSHLFESTLDLATFDASRFAGAVAKVEGQGIRFRTLADGEKETYARKVHGLMSRTFWDIPAVTLAEYPSFEEWAKWDLDEENVPADCLIFAMDGDQVVGATMLERIKTTGAMYTGHTSVTREYRGRGLALALKLLSIEAARRYGAPYMRTNNDAVNAPMLAVNRKLGYVPSPGVYRLEKKLS
jgi:GNAT superfamily N-acetyltransferase